MSMYRAAIGGQGYAQKAVHAGHAQVGPLCRVRTHFSLSDPTAVGSVETEFPIRLDFKLLERS